MSLEKLLYNPEKYRDGANFQATNQVYPVLFEGQRYIVKQVRPLWSFIANAYYTVQDQFFLGTRQLASPWLRMEIEAKKLRRLAGRLEGKGVPQLIHFDYRGEMLVREYLPGVLFRDLTSDQQRQQTLEGALASLQEIHEQNVVVGDAHVKNVIYVKGGNGVKREEASRDDGGKDGNGNGEENGAVSGGDGRTSRERVCWLDLEGIFDESDLVKSKAIDLLKFVYSTYSVTRDYWAALAAAELVVKQYGDAEVKQRIPALAATLNGNRGGNLGVWFSTRLPRDGGLQGEIRKMLRG